MGCRSPPGSISFTHYPNQAEAQLQLRNSVARDPVSLPRLPEFWLNFRANAYRDRAARVEPAARGWIQRAGHIALQDNTLAVHCGIRNGDRTHQGQCIWVQWI